MRNDGERRNGVLGGSLTRGYRHDTTYSNALFIYQTIGFAECRTTTSRCSSSLLCRFFQGQIVPVICGSEESGLMFALS